MVTIAKVRSVARNLCLFFSFSRGGGGYGLRIKWKQAFSKTRVPSRGNCWRGIHVITCDSPDGVHKLDESDEAPSAERVLTCTCM
jgi:hypothetical protein